MRDRLLNPIIKNYIDSKQVKFKNDLSTREDIIEDHSFLWQKIYLTYFVKILKLVIQMIFIAFYVGQYFVIFS